MLDEVNNEAKEILLDNIALKIGAAADFDIIGSFACLGQEIDSDKIIAFLIMGAGKR